MTTPTRTLAVALVLGLGGCTTTAPNEYGGESIYGAGWAGRRDGPRDFYPAAAFSADQDGYAVVSCRIGEGRKLTDCVVVEEGPAGWGFGAAAVRMQTDVIVPGHAANDAPTVINIPFCMAGMTDRCMTYVMAGRAAVDRFMAEAEARAKAK